jgi:hypothetical protein
MTTLAIMLFIGAGAMAFFIRFFLALHHESRRHASPVVRILRGPVEEGGRVLGWTGRVHEQDRVAGARA